MIFIDIYLICIHNNMIPSAPPLYELEESTNNPTIAHQNVYRYPMSSTYPTIANYPTMANHYPTIANHYPTIANHYPTIANHYPTSSYCQNNLPYHTKYIYVDRCIYPGSHYAKSNRCRHHHP